MAATSPAPEIFDLDRAEVGLEKWRWDFAVTQRAEIDRHFAGRQRKQPALWNGRVLLVNRYAINSGALRGSCFETDYASFLAWRDWDFPDPAVFNIFASAALRAADGAYLVGEMAPSTAAAGQIYFPAGRRTSKTSAAAVCSTSPAVSAASLTRRRGSMSPCSTPSRAGGWFAIADCWH